MSPLLLPNLAYLGALLLGLAVLLALMHLQERAAGRYLAHHLGWGSVLATGWIGVPVHELSHLLMAKLFGHRIIAWRLFDPDPVSGTLGYVRHAYSRRSVWQLLGTFFIGMAPLATGALLLAGLLTWMVPGGELGGLWRRALVLGEAERPLAAAQALGSLAVQLASSIWTHRTVLLPLQCYLAVSIALHMTPSPSDLGGALPGAAVLGLLLGAAAAVAAAMGISLGSALGALVPLSLVLLLVSLVVSVYLLSVATAVRLARRRPAVGRPTRASRRLA